MAKQTPDDVDNGDVPAVPNTLFEHDPLADANNPTLTGSVECNYGEGGGPEAPIDPGVPTPLALVRGPTAQRLLREQAPAEDTTAGEPIAVEKKRVGDRQVFLHKQE